MDPSWMAHPWEGAPCHIVLCHATPCRAVLFRATPCNAMSCRSGAAPWRGDDVHAGPCLPCGHDKSPLAHAGSSFLQVFPTPKPWVEQTPPFAT